MQGISYDIDFEWPVLTKTGQIKALDGDDLLICSQIGAAHRYWNLDKIGQWWDNCRKFKMHFKAQCFMCVEWS